MIFAITPLALAARNAGHEVFVAAPENVVDTVAGTGLPCVPVTRLTMLDFMFSDRDGRPIERPTDLHERFIFNGRGMGRFAAGSLDGLLDLTAAWRPDVVVGGALSFSAGLIAAHLGVPFVQHAVDMGEPRMIDLAAAAELAPELQRLGLRSMPEPDLFIDVCPPSLRRPEAPASKAMRYIPISTQGAVEPWMYTKGDRRRVLVTAGSRVTPEFDLDILSGLAEKVSALDMELLIAAPQKVVSELSHLPDEIRVGWLPLDVLAPTCDLLVHHAGGNTMLTGMANGVPQVVVPYLPYVVDYSTRLRDAGAARMILPGEDSPENVADACERVLGDPEYARSAAAIRDEMHSLPTPADLLGDVEALVG